MNHRVVDRSCSYSAVAQALLIVLDVQYQISHYVAEDCRRVHRGAKKGARCLGIEAETLQKVWLVVPHN